MKKWFYYFDKAVPYKKVLPWHIGTLVILIISFTIHEVVNLFPNKSFYRMEINGRVNEIVETPGNTYFLLGQEWYLIKDVLILLIAEGDSLAKEQNCYNLKIYNPNSRLKWQGEQKYLNIKIIEEKEVRKKPRRYN